MSLQSDQRVELTDDADFAKHDWHPSPAVDRYRRQTPSKLLAMQDAIA